CDRRARRVPADQFERSRQGRTADLDRIVRAVTFQALHTPLACETLPDPAPGEGQLVVKVGRCGICGSDLHMTEDAAYGSKHGDVLGHEFAGEVVALGKGTEGLKTGDLVSVIPLQSCGRC